MPNHLIDLTGRKFGRLTVVRRSGTQGVGTKSRPTWACRCECGNQVVVTGGSLRVGSTRSCGCLVGDKTRARCQEVRRTPIECACGDHSFIELTGGFVTLLDVSDALKASEWSWSAKQYSKHLVYARRGKMAPYALHSYLLGENLLDHINGNGLDNRRRNLRPATAAQNQWNARKPEGSRSRFKGVDQRSGLWRARIAANGKRVDLGYYKTEIEAARAYRIAARRMHGEFARY